MPDLAGHIQAALSGEYTIEGELATGGMSRVFAARDEALGRRIVIKILPPEMSARVSVERFKREIALVAVLQHPHIVPLLSAGEVDGLPYFTMPLVEGETVRARLARQGEFAVREAVRVLREIASAIAYAHARGVVHRDIKPENVLLSGGAAMVTDFGVAKALSVSGESRADDGLSSVGIALGTPHYMSPEQATADPLIDHRSDLYSFGVLAYELLTGETPFAGRTPQRVLAAHAVELPEPIDRRRSGLPPGLSAIVMQCLEKRPADRPQSASEVVAALDAIVPAIVVTPPETKRRETVSRVPRFLHTATIALAAMGVIAAIVMARGRLTTRVDHSVAVLPFVNAVGDTAVEYVADGITDELINVLTRVPSLRVVARSSAFSFKGRPARDLREVARQLGVTTIVEGTVRRAGGRLRVVAQLVDADRRVNLWSNAYERDASDVFRLQDELARAIAVALEVQLNLDPTAGFHRGTDDAEAYDLFLKGNHFASRGNREDMMRAIDLYGQAIARDSAFARPWAGIAHTWAELADNHIAPREAYPKSEAAARRALALDPALSEARSALAGILVFYTWDFRSAIREARRALDLNPKSVLGHVVLGYAHAALGESDSAAAHAHAAMSLDPLSVAAFVSGKRILSIVGRFEDAFQTSVRMHRIARQPTARALGDVGYFAKVTGRRHIVDSLLTDARTTPDTLRASAVGTFALGTAVLRDDTAEVRRLTEIEAGRGGREYVCFSCLALWRLRIGDTSSVTRFLRRAYEQREAAMSTIAVDPTFDALRGSPAFQGIIRDVGLVGVTRH